MIELLSPAGSPEAVIAAVQNGADAIYMGMGNFNARRGAKNFSNEEYERAVRYCHIRGCKVYVTLNTLVNDREVEAALQAALATPTPMPQTTPEPVGPESTSAYAKLIKDAVNLRTMPSTEHPDCVIVTKLLHGQVVTRTGIDKQWGWARVEYQGQTLYCINSYLEEVE